MEFVRFTGEYDVSIMLNPITDVMNLSSAQWLHDTV